MSAVADPKHKKGGRYCKRGHEYTPENTHRNIRGIRECRECHREQNRAYKRRHVEKIRTADRIYKARPVKVTCPDCGDERTITRGAAANVSSTYRCFSCGRERAKEKQRRGRQLVCPHCGDSFWRTNAYIAERKPGRVLFCSTACLKLGGGYTKMARELALARGGPGNPAYRHGRRVHIAIPGWKLSRKGESSCRNCGSRDRVQLHHVIPRARSEATKTDLRNGVPLCWTCHTGWHSRKVTIHREIFSAEEWDYLSSVDLLDRRIEAWLDDHYPSRRGSVAA